MDKPVVQQSGQYIIDAKVLIDGLDAGGVGVWRWTVDTNILDWSLNLEAVHALPPGTFDGMLSSFQNDVHLDDGGKVWDAIQNTLATGEPYRTIYRSRSREGGEPLWIEASGRLIEAEDGARYLTGVCMDVTEKVTAQTELEQRLRQQKAVEEFGSFAFIEKDFQAVMDRAVRLAADILDVPLTKILRFAGLADHLLLAAAVGFDKALVGVGTVGTDLDSQAGYTLIAKGPVIVPDLLKETRFFGPQLLHDHKVRSGMSVIIPGESTRPFGVFGVHDTRLRRFSRADTEFLQSLATIVANAARHHEAAEHRQLLMREMAHRAGNMLQMVSTIANQTFKSGADLDQARRAFSERLGSLSRANYLVAKGGWTSTRIEPLFAETLKPFSGRVSLMGRDVMLPPELCFDLGLIVHELAANAAKYGSLGGGEEQVRLSWDVSRTETGGATLTLIWDDPRNVEADRDVPRIGFGSRMLEALIEKKWEGHMEIDRNNGYRFSCIIPFAPAA